MLIKTIQTDALTTRIYDSRAAMGEAAGRAAADAIRHVIAEKGQANVIFAAAPSQNETLAALLKEDIAWGRVHAFHMDEYVGLGIDDRASFARYLYDHVFAHAPFASVHYIPAKESAEEGCRAYTSLLKECPPDVVLMGIGENGHIAFNDPPVADFKDRACIKAVALDNVCRMQQVHDGCFPTIDDVPTHALTLTVPTLMSAKHLICTVPAATKADAVQAMLCGPYGEVCPATALRTHASAVMFLDPDSASKVL